MAFPRNLEPSKPAPSFVDTTWYKYIISSIAACIAEVATYPLDITKTRLQIQGEKTAIRHAVKTGAEKAQFQQYRGMTKTAIGILREEGALKLFEGLTPALYRHFVYSGIRMTVYEYLRDDLFKRNPDGSIDLWKAVISGTVAGAVSQLVASPTDLIKIQMQMEGRRRLQGLPPRVRNMWHAASKIVSEGGIRGLWQGWAPNVQRAALVNMGDLATYDTSKRLILNHTSLSDNIVTHVIAGTCSGFVATVIGTPADVIKARMMNEITDSSGKGMLYKSSMDCLKKAVQQEGFFALYKGFIPHWARLAPWSLTFWVSYEQLRRLSGVQSF